MQQEGDKAMDFIVNISVGILAGIIIGIERQWQNKLAGIRTTALVCFGACMFVTLSTLFPEDGSPTRIAAQVVSGVGFLAGGVIIRDGYSVSGINTAATLWCSAAVGTIIGAGYLLEGLLCALILMTMNVVLRRLSRKVDSMSYSSDTKHYYLSVVCLEHDEIHVRKLILEELNQLQLNFNRIICGQAEGGRVTIIIDLEINERDHSVELRMKTLIEKLLLDKLVLEFRRIGSDMSA